MNDLFLNVRLEALEKNLRQVKDLVGVVRSGTRSVRGLHDQVSAPGAPTTVRLRRVENDVQNILTVLAYPDVAEYVSDYEITSKIDSIRQSVTDLSSTLESVRELVDKLVANVKDTDELLSREHVKNLFVVGATDRLRETMKLKRDLSGNGAGPNPSDPSHWSRYRDLIGDRDQVGLFQEYVDVAAGISLRGTGMDEHFCAMADSLSDHWTAAVNLPYWFAIPARRESKAIPNIIRLGFPEWTIWALPLFAYELGRILTQDDPDFQEFSATLTDELVAGSAADDPTAAARLREQTEESILTYVADAFATYVMGPAYACASLLLRLDPAASGEEAEHGRDLVRAEVVLRTLNKLDPGVQSQLSVMVKTLRDSWEAAVEQLGSARPDQSERSLAQRIAEGVVANLQLIEERNETQIVFGEAAWVDARKQAESYFAGLASAPKPVDVQPRDSDTLPLVLNAAWYWRLEQEPKKSQEIAERVREVIWPRLKPPSGRAPNAWKHGSVDIRS